MCAQSHAVAYTGHKNTMKKKAYTKINSCTSMLNVTNRAYFNVQLITICAVVKLKCAVEKVICAVVKCRAYVNVRLMTICAVVKW